MQNMHIISETINATFVFVISAQWTDGVCSLLQWHWCSNTSCKYTWK